MNTVSKKPTNLEFHSETQIYAPGSQVCRYGILRIGKSFYPAVGSYI